MIAALQTLFAPEIVRFEPGEPLPSASSEDEKLPELPAATVPTLFIDYRVELSGAVLNAKPRGMFFGAGMFFDTLFVLPESDARLELYVKTWRSPTLKVMRLKTRTTADVYEDLARRSFNMFLRRYLDRVFQEPAGGGRSAARAPGGGRRRQERGRAGRERRPAGLS